MEAHPYMVDLTEVFSHLKREQEALSAPRTQEQVQNELLDEILKDVDKSLWNLVRKWHITGYDADDLMQELRIKIWQVIDSEQYDPYRSKPTTFFQIICTNHLKRLNDMAKAHKRIPERYALLANYEEDLAGEVEDHIFITELLNQCETKEQFDDLLSLFG